MEVLTFNRMNYFLINSKRCLWSITLDYSFSFYEYVKSQMHFPIVNSLHGRNIEDYKKVYLFLSEGKNCDVQTVGKVVKYFYYDIYSSITNDLNARGDFDIDLACVSHLFDTVYLPKDLTFNQKVVELNKAFNSEEVYLIDKR